jgi:hypothetical protein
MAKRTKKFISIILMFHKKLATGKPKFVEKDDIFLRAK